MAMTTQNSKRITWIDGLKGIACLLIFTHHFSLEYFNGAYFGDIMESKLPFQLDIRLSYEPYGILTNGNFWVCVFVTLAAFLTAVSVLRAIGGTHSAGARQKDWQEKLSGSSSVMSAWRFPVVLQEYCTGCCGNVWCRILSVIAAWKIF